MTTTETTLPWKFTDAEFDAAAEKLSNAILNLALRKIDETKIFPEFRDDAPNNHADLVAAGEKMVHTGRLPIWNGASDTAVYPANVNMLFRYWHDMGHLEHGLSFSDEDEKALQFEHHLITVANEGIGGGTLAWLIYHADTVGQIQYNAFHGEFPEDQKAFVKAYVRNPETAIQEKF